MENLFYILSIVMIIYLAKRFLFAKNTVEIYKDEMYKDKEFLKELEMIKKYANCNDIKLAKVPKETTPKKVEMKKIEVFYQLNTAPIKLSLYHSSNFRHYHIEYLYQKIVIDNYWINEPFHTEFSKILKFIGNNDLWIKSSKSKEIIVNTRDKDDEIIKKICINVLSLNEVLRDVILETNNSLKKRINLNKYHIQNIILSASIYVLSRSGEIDKICQILNIKYLNEEELLYGLTDKIYEDFIDESKKTIAPTTSGNFQFIVQTYEEIIENIREYPNTISIGESPQNTIKMLPHTLKKQLISIE